MLLKYQKCFIYATLLFLFLYSTQKAMIFQVYYKKNNRKIEIIDVFADLVLLF